MRSGATTRISRDFPTEVAPMVEELNALLAHNERQAEEARRHAGNLAHALKTPLTVIMNAATAQAPDLAETVFREAPTMRRQVDHHLARARAVGRRASAQSRATCGRASRRSSARSPGSTRSVTVDIAGDHQAQVRVERQDLDEMLGNLIENAAKYGGGSVFVTVAPQGGFVEILVEDDGPGHPRGATRRALHSRRPARHRASRAPGSASRSCATWRRSTTARSRSRRARIWAACSCG